MVILLNVLIALYNSAYEDITENAIDEYMALFSQKTMQFVRAPDENVFIAPFNLIELFCLILPFEWWLPRRQYQRLNDYVMGIIYSPLLLVTAAMETRQAWTVKRNRKRGEEDDDVMMEWEVVARECDFEAEGWDKKCQQTRPNVEFDTAVLEVRKLREEVRELTELVKELRGDLKEKRWGEDTLKPEPEDEVKSDEGEGKGKARDVEASGNAETAAAEDAEEGSSSDSESESENRNAL